LFAQRSWQTPSVLATDLTLFMGKRIRFARVPWATAGLKEATVFGVLISDRCQVGTGIIVVTIHRAQSVMRD
jgi:hypothetical protein